MYLIFFNFILQFLRYECYYVSMHTILKSKNKLHPDQPHILHLGPLQKC